MFKNLNKSYIIGIVISFLIFPIMGYYLNQNTYRWFHNTGGKFTYDESLFYGDIGSAIISFLVVMTLCLATVKNKTASKIIMWVILYTVSYAAGTIFYTISYVLIIILFSEGKLFG